MSRWPLPYTFELTQVNMTAVTLLKMTEAVAPSPHYFLHQAHLIQIPLPMIYSCQQSPSLDCSKLAAILLETECEHPHNRPLVQILIFVRSRFAAHGGHLIREQYYIFSLS